ncbi:hypothetical protein BSIN_4022 [Burkholderia singularis]|uniref:Uncharacterized protein n=1 Tax=Burkholderia singularis TaxID=1503053 RepID=A0A238H7N3_9BURK|nr:hypothetical protein BSIN_4022 [Burkholderia singularis]
MTRLAGGAFVAAGASPMRLASLKRWIARALRRRPTRANAV